MTLNGIKLAIAEIFKTSPEFDGKAELRQHIKRLLLLAEERKDDNALADFEFQEFYAAYPRHTHKVSALSAWRRVKKPALLVLLRDLERRYLSTPLQFVPHPATYLTQRVWEDDIIEREPQKTGRLSPGMAQLAELYAEAKEREDARNGNHPVNGLDQGHLAQTGHGQANGNGVGGHLVARNGHAGGGQGGS